MKSYQIVILVALSFISACASRETDRITAAGVVDGDVVTLRAAAGGTIDRADLGEGREVEKGAVLVEINDDKLANQRESLDLQDREIEINRVKLKSRIQLLKANLAYWGDQVARLERLRRSEAVSGDELDKAGLKLQEVETSLTEANQALRELAVRTESLRNQRERLDLLREDHIVKSPVTGPILEEFVKAGETVFPGNPLADVLDRSSLYIEVFLEGEEISRIRVGQDAVVRADGRADQPFKGWVSSIGRTAEFSPKYIVSEKERRSLLYRVKIGLPPESDVFKLGMPVTVVLDKL